jgi:hypothetical protein
MPKDCHQIRASISIAVALFVVIGIVTPGAFAHEGEELEEIVVKGRWDLPLGLAVSASEGVVGQSELDLRPRLRTGDMLEAVPGLIVWQASSPRLGARHRQFFP